MPEKRGAQESEAEWMVVNEPTDDRAVMAAVKEIEKFWSHGKIAASQVEGVKVRTRGSRKTKTNTDYEIDIRVEEVIYRGWIKGEGDPKARCPDTGRVWVTQPCCVCGQDDAEESLLLCGTDDADAEVPGCNRSHHTHCVGLNEVPEDDWFCVPCQDKLDALKKGGMEGEKAE
eukprot:CAMPEP_0182874710 /NCGR_PEP_ID=MMETSP0034_2-20130328/13108_1 /TAXON_ID=156128 /ORGANISM="Nephroselmis pyriformis, Strain CCMP717" /LENGTH=172 /DNA_ID=CAMNT_0025007433 /DNA_START=65 /DNA_END=583 /DNA_ORIENTATION=-